MYNLFQFLKQGFFTTTIAVEKDLYGVIDFNIKVQTSSEDWLFVYEDVQEEAQILVKDLSKHTDIPIPIVGLEFENSDGIEGELVWNEFKIAVIIEENIMIEGWDIFNTSESERLIQTLQKRINI